MMMTMMMTGIHAGVVVQAVVSCSVLFHSSSSFGAQQASQQRHSQKSKRAGKGISAGECPAGLACVVNYMYLVLKRAAANTVCGMSEMTFRVTAMLPWAAHTHIHCTYQMVRTRVPVHTGNFLM